MIINDAIPNLSNEEYHYGMPWREYLSSSQLKLYSRSPKFARFMMDNPQEQTEAQRFGSLFHDLMASMAEYNGDWDGVKAWRFNYAVFEPPINSKTGQPYGATTKAYAEAYAQFENENADKIIASQDDLNLAYEMCHSLWCKCGSTSEQVRKLLKWGKPEVSHFIEYEGCKFKWRPDLETGKKIIDWKTVATNDLSEKSINNIISRYGYDISAAFYLFFEHERSGVWKTFYWLFVSKEPPYDAVLVDSSLWTYSYNPYLDIIKPEVGATKMKRLLDLHIKCTKENNYPGAEINIPQDEYGLRIMVPSPPPWEVNQIII